MMPTYEIDLGQFGLTYQFHNLSYKIVIALYRASQDKL
jgi:hypothetical protein